MPPQFRIAALVHSARGVIGRDQQQTVEFALFVRNVADEVYKTFAFDGSTFFDTTIYFVGEPRTYGLTATFNF